MCDVKIYVFVGPSRLLNINLNGQRDYLYCSQCLASLTFLSSYGNDFVVLSPIKVLNFLMFCSVLGASKEIEAISHW